MEELAFPVTLVRSMSGYPIFDVGAYRYRGPWLPAVGDIIEIAKAPDAETNGPEHVYGYVTRVDRTADTPIRATEHVGSRAPSADDYIVTA